MPSYLSTGNADRNSGVPTETLSGIHPLPNATKAIFYAFGVVAQIPWSGKFLFTLTLPYLLHELEGSPFKQKLASWATTTFTVFGLIGSWITTRQADSLHPTSGITLSISGLAVTLFAFGTLPFWSLPPDILFSLAIVGSLALTCLNSLFRTPVVAVATAFGPQAIASFFSGTALVGVVISAGVFLAACVSEPEAQGPTGLYLSTSLSLVVSLFSLAAFHVGIRPAHTFKERFEDSSLLRYHSEQARLLRAPPGTGLERSKGVWDTTRRNWDYNLAQTMTSITTLAVFPTVTTHVAPTNLRWTQLMFNAFHFLVVNLGVLAGCTLVLARRSPVSASSLLFSLAFPVTIALLLPFCNIRSPGIIGDFGFFTLVFMFALACGHLSSLGFVAVGAQKGSDGRNGTRVLQFWIDIPLLELDDSSSSTLTRQNYRQVMAAYGSIRRGSSSGSDIAGDRTNISSTIVSDKPFRAMTKSTFYLLGVVANIPWNAVVLSLPYLLDRLEDSPLQVYLGASVVSTYNISGLIALATATWMADKLHPTPSITASVYLITAVLLVLSTIPLWPTSTLFAMVLLGTLLSSAANSFLNTPIVAVATAFGSDMLASFFSGTALVGVIGSFCVFILTLISDDEGIADGSLAVVFNFSICALVSIFSLFAFNYTVRNTEIYKTKFGTLTETDPERARLLETELSIAPE
ncbi:Nucleoside transporter [Ceratobasidium sp. AG-Ba]|nr:Nucleoside transporter [Ceratobasidium sp. AG-Ba]